MYSFPERLTIWNLVLFSFQAVFPYSPYHGVFPTPPMSPTSTPLPPNYLQMPPALKHMEGSPGNHQNSQVTVNRAVFTFLHRIFRNTILLQNMQNNNLILRPGIFNSAESVWLWIIFSSQPCNNTLNPAFSMINKTTTVLSTFLCWPYFRYIYQSCVFSSLNI